MHRNFDVDRDAVSTFYNYYINIVDGYCGGFSRTEYLSPLESDLGEVYCRYYSAMEQICHKQMLQEIS